MMGRFRLRKPDVDAVFFDGLSGLSLPVFNNGSARPAWLVEAMVEGKVWQEPLYPQPLMMIETQAGPRGVRAGDWIVRDGNGRLSCVTGSEFHEIYEPLEAS